jgi:hypothetical protein
MERIGDGVRRELSRHGPQAGMPDVLAAWPAAVGDGIAANAWPARIARDGTLHVAVASSAWAFELSQLHETILARLREALATPPKRLRFAPGPLPEPAVPDPGRDPASLVRPTPEQEAQAAEFVTSIEDENLRKLVAKAAALSLAKASIGRSF